MGLEGPCHDHSDSPRLLCGGHHRRRILAPIITAPGPDYWRGLGGRCGDSRRHLPIPSSDRRRCRSRPAQGRGLLSLLHVNSTAQRRRSTRAYPRPPLQAARQATPAQQPWRPLRGTPWPPRAGRTAFPTSLYLAFSLPTNI